MTDEKKNSRGQNEQDLCSSKKRSYQKVKSSPIHISASPNISPRKTRRTPMKQISQNEKIFNQNGKQTPNSKKEVPVMPSPLVTIASAAAGKKSPISKITQKTPINQQGNFETIEDNSSYKVSRNFDQQNIEPNTMNIPLARKGKQKTTSDGYVEQNNFNSHENSLSLDHYRNILFSGEPELQNLNQPYLSYLFQHLNKNNNNNNNNNIINNNNGNSIINNTPSMMNNNVNECLTNQSMFSTQNLFANNVQQPSQKLPLRQQIGVCNNNIINNNNNNISNNPNNMTNLLNFNNQQNSLSNHITNEDFILSSNLGNNKLFSTNTGYQNNIDQRNTNNNNNNYLKLQLENNDSSNLRNGSSFNNTYQLFQETNSNKQINNIKSPLTILQQLQESENLFHSVSAQGNFSSLGSKNHESFSYPSSNINSLRIPNSSHHIINSNNNMNQSSNSNLNLALFQSQSSTPNSQQSSQHQNLLSSPSNHIYSPQFGNEASPGQNNANSQFNNLGSIHFSLGKHDDDHLFSNSGSHMQQMQKHSPCFEPIVVQQDSSYGTNSILDLARASPVSKKKGDDLDTQLRNRIIPLLEQKVQNANPHSIDEKEMWIIEICEIIRQFRSRDFSGEEIFTKCYGMYFEQIYDSFLTLQRQTQRDYQYVLNMLLKVMKEIDRTVLKYYHDYRRFRGSQLPTTREDQQKIDLKEAPVIQIEEYEYVQQKTVPYTPLEVSESQTASFDSPMQNLIDSSIIMSPIQPILQANPTENHQIKMEKE